jgi:hypothetical protein
VRKVLLVVLILIAGLGLVIETRPSAYHVERSTTVNASTDAVYGHVADLHQWGAWSPWDKLDPAMKKDYSGDAGAIGSSYHWTGNDKVGEGRMTVTQADPGKDVGFDLEFIKPFAGKCKTGFAFAPEGAGTKVTWTMDGTSNFMAKAMELFAGNMDKMIGPDFEHGLAGLKQVVEASPAEAAPAESSTSAAPSGAAGGARATTP